MTAKPRLALYESVALLAKVFSSPERLRMVDLLAQRRRNVEELADASRISVKLASHHLQILRREEIVRVEKDGRHAIYGLADAEVARFWLSLRAFAETRSARLILERKQLSQRRREAGMLEREDALAAIQEGRAFVIDVRPRQEFDSAHLPQAVSMPLAELQERWEEIPRDRVVIAYCRGPYCEMADDAVQLLSGKGIKAVRMEDGPLDWGFQGHRLESENAPSEA